MPAPVHVDLAPDVDRALEGHEDSLLLLELDDFHRVRRRHHARTAPGQTVPLGVVLRLVANVVVVDRRRPGHEWHERLEFRSVPLHVVAEEADLSARRRQIANGSGLVDPQAHVSDPRYVPDALLGADAARDWASRRRDAAPD